MFLKLLNQHYNKIVSVWEFLISATSVQLINIHDLPSALLSIHVLTMVLTQEFHVTDEVATMEANPESTANSLLKDGNLLLIWFLF